MTTRKTGGMHLAYKAQKKQIPKPLLWDLLFIVNRQDSIIKS